jgi:hypothetical protein
MHDVVTSEKERPATAAPTSEDNTVSFDIRHAAKAVPRRGWTRLLCLFLPQALAVNSPALH